MSATPARITQFRAEINNKWCVYFNRIAYNCYNSIYGCDNLPNKIYYNPDYNLNGINSWVDDDNRWLKRPVLYHPYLPLVFIENSKYLKYFKNLKPVFRYNKLLTNEFIVHLYDKISKIYVDVNEFENIFGEHEFKLLYWRGMLNAPGLFTKFINKTTIYKYIANLLMKHAYTIKPDGIHEFCILLDKYVYNSIPKVTIAEIESYLIQETAEQNTFANKYALYHKFLDCEFTPEDTVDSEEYKIKKYNNSVAYYFEDIVPEILCARIDFDFTILDQFDFTDKKAKSHTHIINWNILSTHPKLTPTIITKYFKQLNIKHDTKHYATKDEPFITDYDNYKPSGILNHPCITVDFIRTNTDKHNIKWDWYTLTQIIDPQSIIDNPDLPWHLANADVLSHNIKLTPAFVLANKTIKWNHTVLMNRFYYSPEYVAYFTDVTKQISDCKTDIYIKTQTFNPNITIEQLDLSNRELCVKLVNTYPYMLKYLKHKFIMQEYRKHLRIVFIQAKWLSISMSPHNSIGARLVLKRYTESLTKPVTKTKHEHEHEHDDSDTPNAKLAVLE